MPWPSALLCGCVWCLVPGISCARFLSSCLVQHSALRECRGYEWTNHSDDSTTTGALFSMTSTSLPSDESRTCKSKYMGKGFRDFADSAVDLPILPNPSACCWCCRSGRGFLCWRLILACHRSSDDACRCAQRGEEKPPASTKAALQLRVSCSLEHALCCLVKLMAPCEEGELPKLLADARHSTGEDSEILCDVREEAHLSVVAQELKQRSQCQPSAAYTQPASHNRFN